jgi:uncharacterized membrane protein YkvA (DUF1232 family)
VSAQSDPPPPARAPGAPQPQGWGPGFSTEVSLARPARGGPTGRLRAWAKQLKRETLVVYLAARDPRTPKGLKFLALITAGYALSPLDLIPDFIPVIGLLDDLLLVPLGLWLCLRLMPAPLLAELREQADRDLADNRPSSRVAAGLIVSLWVAVAVSLGFFLWLHLHPHAAPRAHR